METPEMLIHVNLFWVSLMRGAGRHMARTGRHWGLAAWWCTGGPSLWGTGVF